MNNYDPLKYNLGSINWYTFAVTFVKRETGSEVGCSKEIFVDVMSGSGKVYYDKVEGYHQNKFGIYVAGKL